MQEMSGSTCVLELKKDRERERERECGGCEKQALNKKPLF